MSDERPRVESPERGLLSMEPADLERLVPEEHPVRSIWAFVERLEWLYATAEGVGSARLSSRLCERDAPYRWLSGGVQVNHHALSDVRVGHGKRLDKPMTQNPAAFAGRHPGRRRGSTWWTAAT